MTEQTALAPTRPDPVARVVPLTPGKPNWYVSWNRTLLGVAGIMLAVPLMASSCDNAGGTPAGGGTVATGTGSRSSAMSVAPSGPVAIGTTMTAKSGDAISVTAFGAAPPTGNEFETAAPGQQCVQATLAFSNQSNAEWSLPTYEVGVVDSSGQKYKSAAMNCGTSDDISSLVAGGHATGKEVFQVPTGSALNLSWVPNTFNNEVYQTKLR